MCLFSVSSVGDQLAVGISRLFQGSLGSLLSVLYYVAVVYGIILLKIDFCKMVSSVKGSFFIVFQ